MVSIDMSAYPENDQKSRPKEFKYSRPVSPQLYENEEFFTIFRPRINLASQVADDAAEECRNDFLKAGGLPPGFGSINPSAGNATALMFPELPEAQLRTIAYLGEIGNIHDGQ